MKKNSVLHIALSSFLIASLGLALPSCASSRSGRAPSTGVLYQDAKAERVTVVGHTREKAAVGDGSTAGYLGGSLGSLAGSVGGGIVGSILGGLVGSKLGGGSRMKMSSRYLVQRADGSTFAMFQDDLNNPIPIGTACYLVTDQARGTAELTRTMPLGVSL